jgi:excisionase family DNA binding protein
MAEMTPMKLDSLRDTTTEVWMTVAQTAEYFGWSTRTVHRKIKEEGLPVHRLGTGPKAPIRVARSEANSWARSRWSARTAGEAQRDGIIA